MIINKPKPRTNKLRESRTRPTIREPRETNRSWFLNDFISDIQCYTCDQDKEKPFLSQVDDACFYCDSNSIVDCCKLNTLPLAR